MKKVLAISGFEDDIAAVRHDLPHMPSLGVSSLDSRPPWRRGGLLFSPVPFPLAICAPRSVALRCSIQGAFSASTRFIRPPGGSPPGYRPVPAPAPSPRRTDPAVTRATVLFEQSCAHRGIAPGRPQSEPHGLRLRASRNAP